MTSLTVQALSKRFAGELLPAVDSATFSVPEGSLTALLGPSGCGKTTLLRMIAGLEAPTSGSIHAGERELTLLPPEHRGISLVFQSGALFPHLPVLENVMFSLEAAGLDRDRARAMATAAMALVGLSGLGERRPQELSGGQQQRVALGRALALAPAVLLLDEPLSNVDARLRRNLRDEIRALQRRLNLTVIYVTHDHREALAVSDQIVLMNEGRVEQAGPPKELYEAPASEFAAAFMGEASVYDGLATGDGMVWLGPLCLSREGAARPAGPVRIAVRPEAWRVGPATGQGLSGSVMRCTYLGKGLEYILATPVGEVLALSQDTRSPLDAGAPVSLYLAGHGVCVIGP